MPLTPTAGELMTKNIHVSKQSFRDWYETCRYVTKVRSEDMEWEWRKGLLKTQIEPGRNSLGEVLVSIETLQRKR